MKTEKLVKQAKRGDKEALLQLIMSERDAYYRLAFTYMGNAHDAMDAVEDMIVALYEKIGQLRRSSLFFSWSKTILVNSCKSLLRKRKRIVLVDNWEETGEGTASEPARSADALRLTEKQLDLQKMLSVLSPEQREAIQLKYLHDLDYKTIADMTGVSVGTAKSRVFQGLKRVREQNERDGGEPV